MNLNVKTLDELLRLRKELTKISDLSFRFSEIRKRYPLDNIDEETAQEVIEVCRGLLAEYREGQNDTR